MRGGRRLTGMTPVPRQHPGQHVLTTRDRVGAVKTVEMGAKLISKRDRADHRAPSAILLTRTRRVTPFRVRTRRTPIVMVALSPQSQDIRS